jgi:hypothetical protein
MPDPDQSSNPQVVSQATRDMAMENQAWVLWKFEADIHSVSDGMEPVGEKLGRVYGFRAAAETARLYMIQDPTSYFMILEPTRPSPWMKIERVFMRRRALIGAGRPDLDPDAGRAFPRAVPLEGGQ